MTKKQVEKLEQEIEDSKKKQEFITKIEDLLRHIHNVQAACVLLGKRLIQSGEFEFGKKLIANSLLHDYSKFFGAEWDSLNTESFENNKSNFLQALKQHQKCNEHHPEHWESIDEMPRIYQAEMVCDWWSRSTEMGTDPVSYTHLTLPTKA